MRAIPARLEDGGEARARLILGFAGIARVARSYEESAASQRQGQYALSAGARDTGVA